MKQIAVLDGYAGNPGDLSWDRLQQLATCHIYDRTLPHQVVERAAGHEMLLTNKVPITASHMDRLPQLRYIGVLATGYNIVDVEAAHSRGIIVTNAPAYSTASVAQLAIAHLLNICCQVQHYTLEARQGAWSRSHDFSYTSTPVMELAGKTMGIVGLGQIGSAVAHTALALGMHVQALTSKAHDALPTGIDKCPTLHRLLATSHVVSLHCPLTADNRHMIDAEALALMRHDAILLNTSRGPLIDENALAEALRRRHILAAGIDVMENEPPRPDNPLLALDNCYITPHIGWASTEARQRLMDITVANVQAYLAGAPINVV